MFKRFIALAGAMLAIAGCAITGFSNPHLYRAATVEVRDAHGHGSGVVIDAHHILTALHVTKNRGDMEVVFSNGDHVPAKTVWNNEALDASIVEVASMPKNTEVAKLDCSELQWGEEVTLVGFPMYDKYVATTGRIASVDYKSDNKDFPPYLLSVDTPAVPGMSGGPVFNSDGKVVGFVDASMLFPLPPMGTSSFTGIGYIVPTSELCPVLPKF